MHSIRKRSIPGYSSSSSSSASTMRNVIYNNPLRMYLRMTKAYINMGVVTF